MSSNFYEWQLIVLVATCTALLAIEKYILRRKDASTHETSPEAGAPDVIVSRLSRQYLCVYAIVMGEPQFFLVSQASTQRSEYRCGLATGTVHILSISRAVWSS